MLSTRDPIRRRQPVERPLDVVALELLVSVSQALLVGIVLSLAVRLGGDARSYGLPIPGLLAVLGVAVGVGWLRWLVGGSGWVMAAVCLAISILTGALWLLGLQDPGLPRIDAWVGLIAATCAIYGLVAGVFLDGPHRTHWKGGVSQPHRGLPQTRTTAARFSPPVQKVVDERLTNIRAPRLHLPTTRIPRPSPRRSTQTIEPAPDVAGLDAPAVAEGLAVAADVAPHPPGPAQMPDVRQGASAIVDESLVDTATIVAIQGAVAPGPVGPGAPSAGVEASSIEAAQPPADPDAPTQPVARPPVAWPRAIEPKGHTAPHASDPPS